MGSLLSKTKYPESVSKAVEKVAKSRSIPSATTNQGTLKSLAESRKNKAIEQDAADPHFLANLGKLGPVKVEHHMATISPEAMQTKTLFLSRESESEVPPQVTRNRLYASSISELLDKRKNVRTLRELEKLAEEFKVDVGVLTSLARVVNSPSVDTSSVIVRNRSMEGSEEGEEVLAPAIWVEPSLKN